jgi:citrate lyase beta subunit
MMTTDRQPLRSFLFAPGNHARRVEKALSLDADAVIFDLEDAVAVAEKPAARQSVAAALGRPRRGWLYVRVAAPTFGQHSDAVLAAYGYPAEEIALLRERGIVR